MAVPPGRKQIELITVKLDGLRKMTPEEKTDHDWRREWHRMAYEAVAWPPPFDAQLARMSLAEMTPGPDGVESLAFCKTPTAAYSTKGYERFYGDFKLVKKVKKAHRDSPLLKLPKKIRMKIYGYVVTYPENIPIRVHSITNTLAVTGAIVKQSWFFNPPLLRTCKQTESDATALFYANNIFEAETRDGEYPDLLRWLKKTDSAFLSIVRRLIIKLEVQSFVDINALRVQQSGKIFGTNDFLAETLIMCGISADRIKLARKASDHLRYDARVSKCSAPDLNLLIVTWAKDLQCALDAAEKEMQQSAAHHHGLDSREYKDADCGQLVEVNGFNSEVR